MFIIVMNQSNIVPDGLNNKLVYKFPNSAVLKDKFIAVSSVSMYYSWFNITSKYANNYFTYTWASTVYTINIPNGLYEISDLNNFIQFTCIQNGTYWSDSGISYYPFEITVNPTRYAIQLNTYLIPSSSPTITTIPPSVGWPPTPQNSIVSFPSNFYSLVGYTPINGVIFSSNVNLNNTYVPPSPSTDANYYVAKDGLGTLSYLSNSYPNIQPNSSLLMSISNINNPYSQPSSIIYSIAPSVAIGELIVDRPPNFMWNKMIDGTYNELRLSLLGTDLQPIEILDPAMTILLAIRDKDESGLGGK